MIVVDQRVDGDLAAEIAAMPLQLLGGERLGPAHQVAVDAAHRSAGAKTVLHGLDLHVIPVALERAEDAAVVVLVAVPVAGAFQMQIAARCGGCSAATCHWLM